MPTLKPMPVKLSGELVEEARDTASRFHRSLTGQIEHWAAIGRAVEAQLPGDALAALLGQLGGTMKIGRVADAPQREQVMAILIDFLRRTPSAPDWLDDMSRRGIPLYGSEPGEAGNIQQMNPDGSIETLAAKR